MDALKKMNEYFNLTRQKVNSSVETMTMGTTKIAVAGTEITSRSKSQASSWNTIQSIHYADENEQTSSRIITNPDTNQKSLNKWH